MGKRKRRQQNNANRSSYKVSSKQNDLFEKYYKIQNIIPENEFEQFLEVLRKPLPTTFRITSFRSHSTDILSFVKENYFVSLINFSNEKLHANELSKVSINSENQLSRSDIQLISNNPLMAEDPKKLVINSNDLIIDDLNVEDPIKNGLIGDDLIKNNSVVVDNLSNDDSPKAQSEILKCLSWYPKELAWEINLDRKNIRQESRLKSLHQFLIQETESGNISRQEAVSMLPPMVLNVQSNSKVLDMCAAPGSKTVQLIEYLHTNNLDPSSSPEGFVLANDMDNKRCYLMVHQINRLTSANYAVVNMDASILPNFFLNGKVVKFDKILCDVPCSGDGTLRKNVDAWEKWNPGSANGLHNLQKRILSRGIDMLAQGGELVYSTCSLNPVENEAVVANMLIKHKDSLELVDLTDVLKNLKWRPGFTSWNVMTKKEELFDNFLEVPERLQTQISESLFPPAIEDLIKLNLHRCIRILPHDQNTGGFFLALFRKKMEIQKKIQIISESMISEELNFDSENDKGAKNEETNKRKFSTYDNKKSKKFKFSGYKEDPFIFLKNDDEIWNPIKLFYGITEDFPFSQLMVRCETGKKRNIYFVSSIIKNLVQTNEEKFKFINFGVKILTRSEHKEANCQFRLVQDAIHILYPYVTKRVVTITKDDVITLLTSENPYINRLSKYAGDQINLLGQGGCIFVCNDLIKDGDDNRRLILCGWKGKVSCRSFLPKNDREHMLRLCGHMPIVKICEDKTGTLDELDIDIINQYDIAEDIKDNNLYAEKEIIKAGDPNITENKDNQNIEHEKITQNINN